MTEINKDIEKYLSQVKSYLPCRNADKTAILEDIRQAILDFTENSDIQSIDDIYKRFGTPEEIARSYLSDADPKKISKAFNIKKIILIAVIAVIIIYIFTMIYVILDAHNVTHGYFVECHINFLFDLLH